MKPECYVASPFFNDFEVIVRDRMRAKAQEKFGKVFSPQHTFHSKLHDIFKCKLTMNTVFRDNFKFIRMCDNLVFPSGTTDLGTFFEIGVALACNKTIWRYDYVSDTLTRVDDKDDVISLRNVYKGLWERYNKDSKYLIDAQKPINVVYMGFLYQMHLGDSLKLDRMNNVMYELPPEIFDNIMLGYTFNNSKGYSLKESH